MSKRINWTRERIAASVAILKEHTDRRLALAALGLPADGWGMLDAALHRHGKGRADSYLAAPPAPPPTDIPAARERIERHATAADVRELQRKLVEYEQAANFYTSLREIPSIELNRSRPKSGLRVATPIDVASDWHIGEVVTEEETLGRNTYNLAEAQRRAANYWDNVLWLRAKDQQTRSCDDHILNLNGDIISGSIHLDLTETNEVPLVEQVEHGVAMIRPGVEALAAASRRVIVGCTHGNHSRITAKSMHKIGWAVSLESILYRWLRDSLRHLENVEWIIPRAEGFAIDVHGRRVQFQHGTQIKSQGGIGGILVPLNRFAARAACAQYYVFGHFHQACWFGSAIVNGSLIGDSAYSKWHGMTFRPPEQVRFVIDEKRGLRSFDPVSVT